MTDEQQGTESVSNPGTPSERRGKRQKVRIRYRQRVKLKKRPRGYRLKRFWKKHSRNVFVVLVLTAILGATAYTVIQVVKKEIEQKQHERNQRLKTY